MAWPDTSWAAYERACYVGLISENELIAVQYMYSRRAFSESDVAIALDMYDRDYPALIDKELHKVGKELQRKGIVEVAGHLWWRKTRPPAEPIISVRVQGLQLTGETGSNPQDIPSYYQLAVSLADNYGELREEFSNYPEDNPYREQALALNGLLNQFRQQVNRRRTIVPTPDRIFWDPLLAQDERRSVVERMDVGMRCRCGVSPYDNYFGTL